MTTIGVISGTGPAGRGVATRLAAAGYHVVLGSRDIAKSQIAVQEMCAIWGTRRIAGLRAGTNDGAARCDIVIFGSSAESTLAAAETHREELAGKIVLSMSAGMARGERGMKATVGTSGSIAEAVQQLLPESEVVASLHHVAAGTLCDPLAKVEADLFVVANNHDAMETIAPLLESISDGQLIDAGTLDNAVALEAMTAVLVTANIKSKAHSSLRLIDTSKVAQCA